MTNKMKNFANFIQNENFLAYHVHCFKHKVSLVWSKSCDFVTIRNMFSTSTKACDNNQIVINQKLETGRNVQ